MTINAPNQSLITMSEPERKISMPVRLMKDVWLESLRFPEISSVALGMVLPIPTLPWMNLGNISVPEIFHNERESFAAARFAVKFAILNDVASSAV